MTDISPRWVDFHCHLDLYPDHLRLLKECENQQVATLAVTTTPAAWKRNRELATGKYVKVALGLHPQLVADRAHEIELWQQLLPQADYVGEVGLDAGPRYFASFERQKAVFQTVLQSCAEAGGKTLSIHSVRCAPTVLSMLETYLPPARGKAVLHWFTGSKADARRAHDLGCYFSVNADMMRSDRGRDLVSLIHKDRILTETDGPFGLIDGKPARPTNLQGVVRALADLRGIEPAVMAETIIQNWSRVTAR
jgi:TatD DNase family protein